MFSPIITELNPEEYDILGEYAVYYADKMWHVRCTSGRHIFNGAQFYDKFDALNWTARLAVDHHQGEAIRELLMIATKDRKII